ncbi:helix-turn-helix domain-containing protein [Aeromicrobium sp. UC242_57]|uniref:helix-turn-helix domain-containing protein n=1 Tax=Aeromicrobium sp. UC242_57 TaxID=3374624 RepID=UPI0037A211EB
MLDGGATVGALVRLRPLQTEPTDSGRLTIPSEPRQLPGLVGQSPAWTDMRRKLSTLGGRTLVLVGERGTGKTSVGRALLQSEGVDDIVTVDASGLRTIDERAWLGDLSRAASGDSKAVLLTHVEHIGETIASSVHAALSDARERGLRVVATCAPRGAGMESPMLGWFDVEVAVPSLADRSDDIAVLLEELSWRVTGGMRRSRWTSDVVQTVSRASWPGNVAALDSLVRSIIKDGSKDRVTAADLPASVKARASRRQLVGLERVEAQAIIQALEAVDGNKKAAADALGIARSTLYRKVRALGIDLAGSTF